MSSLNVDKGTCSIDNNDKENVVNHDCNEEKEAFLTSDDGNSSTDGQIVIPPDGGWGWVVVFGSFMCNMIVDGIITSFASFTKPISETFNVSEPHVALIGSLMSGFYLIVGPFASALSNRYGFQLVAIVGTILSVIAFTLSYFATSYQVLYATFGILGGIGFGFIYVPAVITLVFYFEKWRALASGIAVCGSGIGIFLFAPITSWLINELGWRTTFLCHGGIVLTCLIFGALFKPLKVVKANDIIEKEMVQIPNKLSAKALSNIEKALEAKRRHSHNCDKIKENQKDFDVYHTIHTPQYKSNNNGTSSCNNMEKIWLSVPFISNNEKSNRNNHNEQNQNSLYRQDMFFSGSLNRLPQYTSSRTSVAYNMTVTKKVHHNKLPKKTKGFKKYIEIILNGLSQVFDFSLFKSISFLIIAFSGFLTMMGFYVPFMYLTNRALNNGIDKKSAIFLISAIGIANTIGRVLCGILSSFPGVNALFVTNVALTIGGIATIFSGISMSPYYQFTYAALFGLSISCFASLRSIVVVDLLGLEKLTSAFGLLLLFQGIAAVIGAPLAGAFSIATGSYDSSFYLSGGLILSSALMCYPLNYINKWETKRKAQATTITSNEVVI